MIINIKKTRGNSGYYKHKDCEVVDGYYKVEINIMSKNSPIKFKYICDYEYLCYLNNDVIVSSNFIDDTINVLDNNKEIGVVIHVTNNTNYCQRRIVNIWR